MRGYKYVKFSKGTAKGNPEMIDREYTRLINEASDASAILALHQNKMLIPLNNDVLTQIVSLYNNNQLRDVELRKNEAYVNLNFNELKIMFDEAKKKVEVAIKTKALKDKIVIERQKFRLRFILKR